MNSVLQQQEIFKAAAEIHKSIGQLDAQVKQAVDTYQSERQQLSQTQNGKLATLQQSWETKIEQVKGQHKSSIGDAERTLNEMRQIASQIDSTFAGMGRSNAYDRNSTDPMWTPEMKRAYANIEFHRWGGEVGKDLKVGLENLREIGIYLVPPGLLVALLIFLNPFGLGDWLKGVLFQPVLVVVVIVLGIVVCLNILAAIHSRRWATKFKSAIAHDVGLVELMLPELKKKQERELQSLMAARDAEILAEQQSSYYPTSLNAIEARFKAAKEAAQAEANRIEDRYRALSQSISEQVLAVGKLHPAWEALTTHLTTIEAHQMILGKCTFQPVKAASNLGAIHFSLSNKPPLAVPYTFLLKRNLVLSSKATASANMCLQNVVARAIASFPPGQLKMLFLDPVGLGQNASFFMRLSDHDETLIHSRAWSETKHMEQRLAEVAEHIENVIQKYLRNEYSNIDQYNANAVGVPEAYRLLVVFDYPVRFSSEASRQLLNIMQNGPRCGVYTLMVVDESRLSSSSLDSYASMADFKRHALVLNDQGGVLVGEEFPELGMKITPNPLPSAEVFNTVVDRIGSVAKENNRVEVNLEGFLLPEGQWWSGDSSSSLSGLLGPAGGRKNQFLEFGQGTSHHGLVVGRTGSGKSVLLHTLITSLVTTYSPLDLSLYLVDFKEGVEFKRYANHQLPHAKVVAIRSEREYGLSVLQGVDKLIAARGELFKNSDAKQLSEVRSKLGRKVPRVLVIFDEFQVLFSEDDKIATEALSLLDRIVRQGRSFGVHVLLCSQTLAGSGSLPRAVMDQMYVRIALQCSEADSRIILAEDNPAARLLSRPGEAIYNASNGTIEGNNRFQVAMLQELVQESVLQKVRSKANALNFRNTPQVFEGDEAASLEQYDTITPLATKARAQAVPTANAAVAILGEPTSIKDPTSLKIKRQSGNNLMVMGSNERATSGVLGSVVLSLAAQLAPHQAKFAVLDFSAPEEGEATPLWEKVKHTLPHDFKIGKRRELPGILEDLDQLLQERLDQEVVSPAWQNAYLVIAGLQRARDLRSDDSNLLSFDEDKPARAGDILSKLLRDGPEMGIHVLFSCDTLANFNRTVLRRSMKEIDYRVCLQMGTDDSMSLIDSPSASKLGPNRAYLYSAEEGRMEKFRPYQLPSDGWLSRLANALRLASPQATAQPTSHT